MTSTSTDTCSNKNGVRKSLQQWAKNHNLAFTHGHLWHVVWRLATNHVLLIKWRICKRMHHIGHPVVHYYAVCWNEEKMLPFMFDHYKQIVDHFYIYDNHSTDSSQAIVKAHPNAKLEHFHSNGFDDESNINIKNHCWKQSRGKADYVIVCDIDEFLYAPDLRHTLNQMLGEGITIPSIEGYEMFSASYPHYPDDTPLALRVQNGIRSMRFDKAILFDPHRIVEINYTVGAHECNPTGIVRRNPKHPLKLLHYKHLGTEYMIQRYQALAQRLSAYNRENGFGNQYLNTEQEIIAEMEEGLRVAQEVVKSPQKNK